MKPHKKRFVKRLIAGLLTAVLLSALPSCKAPKAPEPHEPKRVDFTSFKDSLFELVDATGTYKISLDRTTETDDGAATMHVFDITQDLVYSQERLTLFTHCDADNSITSVYCSAGKEPTSTSIALICYYVYESLGLTEMDADTFYDTFAFFEDAPREEHEKEENGWCLRATYKDEGATFYAFYL
jgi:hypothetical protein